MLVGKVLLPAYVYPEGVLRLLPYYLEYRLSPLWDAIQSLYLLIAY